MHNQQFDVATKKVELFQLWILPIEKNLKPNYGQKEFDKDLKKNKLLAISCIIRQIFFMYEMKFPPNTRKGYK